MSVDRPQLIKQFIGLEYESPFVDIKFDENGRELRRRMREDRGNKVLPKRAVAKLRDDWSRPL